MPTEDEIIFSRHAVDQMQERNIGKTEAVEAIRFPDHLREQTNGFIRAMKRVTRNNRQYLLVAVYRDLPASKSVVTIFLTSKVRKYLAR